jgi:hypothetical protein
VISFCTTGVNNVWVWFWLDKDGSLKEIVENTLVTPVVQNDITLEWPGKLYASWEINLSKKTGTFHVSDTEKDIEKKPGCKTIDAYLEDLDLTNMKNVFVIVRLLMCVNGVNQMRGNEK